MRAFARRGKAGPVVALAAAVTVIALLLVTAIASRKPLSGEGQAVAPVGGGHTQINAPPWALVLVAVGAAVALLGVLATTGLPRLRRHKDKDPELVRVFTTSRLARAMALLVPLLVGVALVVAAIEGSRARTPIRPGGIGVPRAGKAPVSAPPSPFTPPTWILPAVLAVVLGGGGTVLLVIALRGRREEHREHDSDLRATAVLGEAVDASLDDLRNEPDPRRAVIAAYRRMEATLGDAGLPRRAWEAPREYSGRAYNYLELSARPLQTLTTLFERARFGIGRVGEPLREQAIAALIALREELHA